MPATEGLPTAILALYQELDRQTYDDRARTNWDAPDDYEHHVVLTAGLLRKFDAAVEAMPAKASIERLSAIPRTAMLAKELRAAAQGFRDASVRIEGDSETADLLDRAAEALSAIQETRP